MPVAITTAWVVAVALGGVVGGAQSGARLGRRKACTRRARADAA